ncbi:MAG: PQQ-binding-like beta-propeller repeat protein [Planctomycetota bacterium]
MNTKRTKLIFGVAGFLALALAVFPGVLQGQALPDPNTEEDYDPSLLSATLKTDPELESILEQAGRFKDDGNWNTATQLWQAVLERSGDTLYSADEETYFSLALQVEKVLADLPPDGLQAYRITADASAREILAAAGEENDVIALNQVVREYFVSSLGDEAAYRLGCIYLDRHDFTGARRMFEKIINHYPDPTVPLDQVYVRIALCQSFLGEIESAEESLTAAEDIDNRSSASQIRSVRDTLGQIQLVQNSTRPGDSWVMNMGDSRRFGLMPDLPDSLMQTGLEARWQYYVEPQNRVASRADAIGNVLTGSEATGEMAADTVGRIETDLITAWREKNWNPAGGMLIADDRIYFKSAADVIMWNTDSIVQQAAQDDGRLEPEWRSVWLNSFRMDDASMMLESVKRSFNSYSQRRGAQFSNSDPASSVEVQYFGDRIFQQMSIYNGVLYNIECAKFDDTNTTPDDRPNAQWNVTFRRTRSNYLTAYDAATGMVLWRVPKLDTGPAQPEEQFGEEEESPFLEAGGFMSAPIGFGRLIIGAVNQGGAISVYALDPQDEGRTVWKAFLCDEPESGANPWSAINLSIEGSDLFVSCGMGVVFVLDPATGMIRFAKRYERSAGVTDTAFRRLRWNNPRVNYEGWKNDVVIPYGRQMICFCSDSKRVDAFDRNSGEVIWIAELQRLSYNIDYVLGVYDDKLYAAGPETIIAFDLKGEGRMLWGGEQLFGGKKATGRGMLTPSGIYMPVEDQIYKFNTSSEGNTAELLRRVNVDLGTGAPVGNLFSDGRRERCHDYSCLLPDDGPL